MTCPNCAQKLTMLEAARQRCPRCGRPFDRSAIGLVKTSSVLVASGEGDQVYHTLEDLPPELRDKLQKALSAPEAETIILADEQGRDQIFQVIRSLPPDLQNRVLSALRLAGPTEPQASPGRPWKLSLLLAGAALLAVLLWWIWR
ncbi:MAG: hypothetical protein HY238_04130 [Acidobacteria bacterium]|nr:hypothetical protein [Acidobacteriota bacterium]